MLYTTTLHLHWTGSTLLLKAIIPEQRPWSLSTYKRSTELGLLDLLSDPSVTFMPSLLHSTPRFEMLLLSFKLVCLRANWCHRRGYNVPLLLKVIKGFLCGPLLWGDIFLTTFYGIYRQSPIFLISTKD